MNNPRQIESQARLEERITKLEEVIRQMGAVQCMGCFSWFTDPQNMLRTSQGSACLDCLVHDEYLLEGIKIARHDIQRLSDLLRHRWQMSATVDGKRFLNGGLLINPKPNGIVATMASVAWKADCVLWDIAEGMGNRMEHTKTGRAMIYDPRKFHTDNGIRVLKDSAS